MGLIPAVRSFYRLITVLWTAFEAAIQFVLMKIGGRASAAERAHWLHRACARALRRLNIPVEHTGDIPENGLIVANHLSYLDILALSTLAPFVFIAKKEVRSWAIFGWMAKTGGSLFVDRERKLDTGKVNESLGHALQAGLRVVLFAEGTSTDGSTVLPFRPSLFAPALAAGAAITPAYISYVASSGSVANDVCYWGEMTFLPHAAKLFSIRAVTARINFGPAIRDLEDRKQAAEVTRAEVLRLAGLPARESQLPTGKMGA
jgi:1-acyl-sn-glycerol-3-phosphate acyltransferase